MFGALFNTPSTVTQPAKTPGTVLIKSPLTPSPSSSPNALYSPSAPSPLLSSPPLSPPNASPYSPYVTSISPHTPASPSLSSSSSASAPRLSPTIPGYRIVGQPIGNGSYGVVWKAARVSDGMPVAIKQIVADKNILTREILNEVSLQRFIRHPNIMPLIDVVNIPGDGLMMVMPLAKMDLAKMIHVDWNASLYNAPFVNAMGVAKGRELFNKRREIVFGMKCGLDYLHASRFMHLDLKPENILMNAPASSPSVSIGPETLIPMIADPGLSSSMFANSQGRREPNLLVTYSSRPPENLCGNRLITEAADRWSFGFIACNVFFVMNEFQSKAATVRGPGGSVLEGTAISQATLIHDRIGWPESFRRRLEALKAIDYTQPERKNCLELKSVPQKTGHDLARSILGDDIYNAMKSVYTLEQFDSIWEFLSYCFQVDPMQRNIPESLSLFAGLICSKLPIHPLHRRTTRTLTPWLPADHVRVMMSDTHLLIDQMNDRLSSELKLLKGDELKSTQLAIELIAVAHTADIDLVRVLRQQYPKRQLESLDAVKMLIMQQIGWTVWTNFFAPESVIADVQVRSIAAATLPTPAATIVLAAASDTSVGTSLGSPPTAIGWMPISSSGVIPFLNGLSTLLKLVYPAAFPSTQLVPLMQNVFAKSVTFTNLLENLCASPLFLQNRLTIGALFRPGTYPTIDLASFSTSRSITSPSSSLTLTSSSSISSSTLRIAPIHMLWFAVDLRGLSGSLTELRSVQIATQNGTPFLRLGTVVPW